ncbi:MAG: site-2 protease family protein [Candidatus Gracilibacteria bacterium]
MMTELFFIVALVISVTIHEFSHAWTANYLGDPTAKYYGRITLNPLKHLDFWGTVMLFLIGFGWGKPVPVNPNNFSNSKRDSALVSLAGPMSNFLLAVAVAMPYKYLLAHGASLEVTNFLRAVFDLCLILGLFNLLPLPPLDGSKIVGIFVPDGYYHRYQLFLADGMKWFIGFILVDSFVLSSMLGFSVLDKVMYTLYDLVSSFILIGTGQELVFCLFYPLVFLRRFFYGIDSFSR